MNLLRSMTILVLLVCAQAAFGHGFQLSLSDNKIVGTGDDFLGGTTTNPSTYSSGWTSVTPGTLYNKGAGGVQPSATGGLSLANGDTFSLEFFGPLMFSSGGAATPVAAGVSMAANSYVSTTYTAPNLIDTLNLDGTFSVPDFLDVSGNTSHSIQWVLTESLDQQSIPPGVYGFAYRVYGSNSVSHNIYDSSTPMVVLLNTPDFTDATSVIAARAAVLSAVPEPNSLILASTGLMISAGLIWQRRIRYASVRQLFSPQDFGTT